MDSGLALALTAAGMQQLANELAALQERRAALAESLGASPDDIGEVQGELFLVDRRMTELQAVLARAQPLDETDRVPGVVGVGSRVTVHWEEDGEETSPSSTRLRRLSALAASHSSPRLASRCWSAASETACWWRPLSDRRGSSCLPLNSAA